MFKVVGTSVPPLDGAERATGRAEYVTDIKFTGMLYGKVLLSAHPHARILRIDTSKARAISGVKAVLTFEDTNRAKFGPLIPDWYIFPEEKVRFIGEEIAAVAAVDEETAQEALDKIVVEYEPLPSVFDPEEAFQEGSPIINEGAERNAASSFILEKGDMLAAEKDADLVLNEKFYTNQVYQAYLEPVACVAKPEGRGLTMYLPIQIPGRARHTYAKALGISPDNIRVIKPFVGGAFGAKMEDNWHIICGLLALKTQKSVKVVKTREEDIISGNPRVPMHIYLKMGFKKSGQILFKDCKLFAGNGGRTSHGPAIMSTACYRMDNTYRIANIKTEGYAVYTNTLPTGCFRGFGNAQMVFAMESMLDQAATELNINPAELRMQNSYRSGDLSVHGWKLNTVGLNECIEKVCGDAAWESRRKDSHEKKDAIIKTGIGLACTNHVSGNRNFFPEFDGSTAFCRIGEGGKVTIFHGESDIGQGQDTAYAIIVAEEIGVNLENVSVAMVDTQICGFGMGSFSTRGTLMGGNAVRFAAIDAKQKVLESATALLKTSPDELVIDGDMIFVSKDRQLSITFADACRSYVYSNGGMPILGQGIYKPDTVMTDPKTKYGNVSPAYPFGAHIAEVDVDTETGEISLMNYWACHDVGQVINKLMIEGQLEGGIVQGAGWTLMEDMIIEDGKIINPNFLDYRCPGAQDTPKMHYSFVETNDPNGPFGAKGIGEPSLNPVPAAIANALFNAIGIRFNELPITAEKVLRAIKE